MNANEAVRIHLASLAAGHADFDDTLALIERHFDYQPVGFHNGPLFNAAGENAGSCRVFALGQYCNLNEADTLSLFSQHYQQVLNDPTGDSHGNIRQFISTSCRRPERSQGREPFMSDTATSGVQHCFQLKSASVSMTALELYYFENDEFEDTLRDKISQAPGFFKDIPLIISLEKYEGLSSELDFFKIIGTCRRHNI
ncbi:unnamed protein product, partial [Ectocarpus sp. 12 AP-2014]